MKPPPKPYAGYAFDLHGYINHYKPKAIGILVHYAVDIMFTSHTAIYKNKMSNTLHCHNFAIFISA